MRKSTRLTATLLGLAFLLVGTVSTSQAQEKKHASKAVPGQAVIKEIEQNDKVRVYEVLYKAGETLPSAKRPMRVIHVIKGGTLERTFEDGKKESLSWKTGETKIVNEEKPYALKNVSKGTIHLLVVAVK